MKIYIHAEEENLYNRLNKPVYEYYNIKLKAFVVIKDVTDLLSQFRVESIILETCALFIIRNL